MEKFDGGGHPLHGGHSSRRPGLHVLLLTPARYATFRRTAETLAIGAIGGTTLGLLHLPAGWLIGAMIAVASAALAGRPMLIPRPLMNVIFVFIGISLGSVVTPETLHGMGAWPLSLAIMIVAIVTISLASSAYLRYAHGWGNTAALLASAPGALSQVMVMANELGVDVRAVVIVQTLRVMIVSVGLPSALTLLGLVGPNARSVGGTFSVDQLGELSLLISSSAFVAYFFLRFRIPGGLLFGAMLCSGALHGSGYVHALMPWWAANAAMLALGSTTGSRFANTSPRLLLDFIWAALGCFVISVVVAALFVAILALGTPLRIADVSIAFAPGAVDAMMVLALALNLDPVYVGAHHLARIVFISVTIPFIARWSVRQARLPPEPEPPRQKDVPFED
jgi:membrane AbrB-like protein